MHRATLILPSTRTRTHANASRSAPLERLCVPVWTILLYLRAASTILRPSHTLCETGFSTYTSLPAWHAQMENSACQWFGVAVETASISLSSSSLRRSALRSAPLAWTASLPFRLPLRRAVGLPVGLAVGRVDGRLVGWLLETRDRP